MLLNVTDSIDTHMDYLPSETESESERQFADVGLTNATRAGAWEVHVCPAGYLQHSARDQIYAKWVGMFTPTVCTMQVCSWSYDSENSVLLFKYFLGARHLILELKDDMLLFWLVFF